MAVISDGRGRRLIVGRANGPYPVSSGLKDSFMAPLWPIIILLFSHISFDTKGKDPPMPSFRRSTGGFNGCVSPFGDICKGGAVR